MGGSSTTTAAIATHLRSALSIANTITLTVIPFRRSGLSVMFTPAFQASFSIVGSRLMLNLRDALELPSAATLSTWHATRLDGGHSQDADQGTELGSNISSSNGSNIVY